jgi:multiple sugar transport system ATP-binding protein
MAVVVFDAVGKVYEDGTRAVRDLSLEIGDGELLVLVGPSGCGKTTALRMLAGLEDITEGQIRIGDRVVNDMPSRDRDVAMVFQSYALYPHLTVKENIAFGLKLRKLPRDEIERRVAEAARILGLSELLERKPRHLSGGQRQRVAMGRAIVRQPQVFLMDEPLSNLDAKLRVQMRVEIARIQNDLTVTTVYVTHDQTEAMTLGDRVAVMRKGELLQVGPPQTLYDDPDNLFVAAFIGSPAMNLLEGALATEDDQLVVVLGDVRFPVPDELLVRRPAIRSYSGRKLIIGIRPEDLDDASLVNERAGRARIRGSVELTESLGSDVFVHARIGVPAAVTEDTLEIAEDMDPAALDALERRASGGTAVVIARCDPRTQARVGETIELAVDTTALHLFDPDTGHSIAHDHRKEEQP